MAAGGSSDPIDPQQHRGPRWTSIRRAWGGETGRDVVSWTKRELDEAVTRYERDLIVAGRTPGTIATYVGDARRFVEWLAGAQVVPAARGVRPSGTHRILASARVRLIPPIRAPRDLQRLAAAWERRGRPPQPGIPWPRDRWVAAFPHHRATLQRLPDVLDRDGVRAVAAGGSPSATSTEAAFVATMAWGFGWVGYGPHRAVKMLATPDAAARLLSVRQAVVSDGALAAYGRLAGDCRIKGLGPAFGTKFITFCQPPEVRPRALIHDELVSTWLAANGRPDLSSTAWSGAIYEAYLDQVHRWADELRIDPEAVEYLIFQAMADERGNQWATSR